MAASMMSRTNPVMRDRSVRPPTVRKRESMLVAESSDRCRVPVMPVSWPGIHGFLPAGHKNRKAGASPTSQNSITDQAILRLRRLQRGVPSLQKTPHRGVGFEADRQLIGGSSFGRLTDPSQQVGARGPIGLVLREAHIAGDVIERRKADSGAAYFGERDRAVDGNDRGVADSKQCSVERFDR